MVQQGFLAILAEMGCEKGTMSISCWELTTFFGRLYGNKKAGALFIPVIRLYADGKHYILQMEM